MRKAAFHFVITAVLLWCATNLDAATPVDPGPRPAGNKFVNAFGANFHDPNNPALTLNFLTTPLQDFREPPDVIGDEGAGNAIANSGNAGAFWFRSIAVFGQLASVNGAIDSTTQNPTNLGLGPAFNGNSCFMCHSFPTIGGTSPAINPQVAVAHDHGASNPADLLSFIFAGGPIREARFILNEAGGLDGGVHELFSIQGRSDAPSGCTLAQPNFAAQLANHNVIFRIPTPTFGLGLVENMSNEALRASFQATATARAAAGIGGHFNTNGNDGTITRFGWKAQNKSLLLFSGEASNVELGVTNEIFGNEKVPGAGCAPNGRPEDNTHILFNSGTTLPDVDSLVSSDIENFAIFMRLNGSPSQCAFDSGLDPTPGPTQGNPLCFALNDPTRASSSHILNGRAVFERVGCNLCHTQNLVSDPSDVPGLSNRAFHPFSDFAVHHMGAKLADGITQGTAGPDEFRTAPLWGLGQRLFFLHDGRATNLVDAIMAHSSDATICFDTTNSETFTVSGTLFTPLATTHSCGSEANQVITNLAQNTTDQDKQDLLFFLRSL